MAFRKVIVLPGHVEDFTVCSLPGFAADLSAVATLVPLRWYWRGTERLIMFCALLSFSTARSTEDTTMAIEPEQTATHGEDLISRGTLMPPLTGRELIAAIAYAGLLANRTAAMKPESLAKDAVSCADVLLAYLRDPS